MRQAGRPPGAARKPLSSRGGDSPSVEARLAAAGKYGFGHVRKNVQAGDTPGVFHSIEPAWNDRNLRDISSHITRELQTLTPLRKADAPCLVNATRGETLSRGSYCPDIERDQHRRVERGCN
jgi:hypothetical protein